MTIDLAARRTVFRPLPPNVRYQFQTTECGVAALGLMLAYHGRHVALEQIRAATGVSRDCMNAADMVIGARHFGLECKVRKCEPEKLAGLGLPLIVYLNFIHFNVLEEVTETHMRLVDPHSGRVELSHAQFNEQFTGIALSFAPTAEFRRDRVALRMPWLVRQIGWRGAGWILTTALSSILAAAASVGAAFAVAASDTPTLMMALAVLTVSTFLGRTSLASFKRVLTLKLSEAATQHVLGMTSGFFAYRIPDRLVDVIHSADTIGKRICDDIVPIGAGLLGLPVLVGGAWAIFEPAGIALASVAVIFGLVCSVLTWAPWMRYVKPPESSSQAYGGVFSALERIETWKTGTRTRDFQLDTLDAHAADQARSPRTRKHELAVSTCRALVPPTLIVAVLLAVVPALRRGGLEWGEGLAVILLAVGMAPFLLRCFMPKGVGRALHKDLFHLEDAMTARPDDGPAQNVVDTSEPLPPGALATLNNIRFGHSRQRHPILDGVSLTVRQGEQLGITGPSGGGKSTIARLLAGVETPWSGEVRVDNSSTTPVVRAWLDKAPTFFEASLRDNLALWQGDVSDEDIWSVLDAVCMANLIRERDGGLDAPIARMGGNFSGGQLQRLEIARALLTGANFLIVDEALDALNPELEATVRANLRARGCTLVVVSHRHSTLAGCERVLRVVDGQIVDAVNEAEQSPPQPPIAQDSPMASVFSAGLAVDVEEDPYLWPVDAQLRSAFRFLATHYGTRLSEQEPGPDAADIDETAAAYGFDLRSLRFLNPEWWRLDGTPCLVRERATKRVMAVVPSATGSVLYDPATNSRRPFPSDPVAMFEAEAYRVYPRQDGLAQNPLSLVAEAVSLVRGDVVRLLAAIVAIGLLSAVWPLILSSGAGPLALAGGAASLLMSFVLLEVAGALHERRAESLVEHGILHALVRRCAIVTVPFVRASRREDIAAAVNALPRAIEIFRQTPLRHLAGIVTAIAVLGILLATDAAWEAGLALVLILTGVGIAVLTANLRLSYLERMRYGRSASRRFLFTALDGIFRFRALGADWRVAGEWLERFQTALKPLHQEARLTAMSDAVLTVLPWVGVAGLVAEQGASVRPFTGFAVWLAIASACEFARALGSWLDVRADIGRMALMTQAPVEPTSDIDLDQPDALSLHGVCAGYQGKAALTDVSLAVRPGEIVAVAGASGSGKSTLIDVMLGFHDFGAGSLRIDGNDFRSSNVPRWHGRVATVLQRDRLDVAMTVRGQIAGRAPIGLPEIWQRLQEVELDAEVAAMPMATQSIVDDFRLSTGQRQRLLLARALARYPRLLFLDEALSAVPDDMKERLIEMIRGKRIAAVIVTHDEHLIGLADRVCVLDQGRIAYDGPPANALDDPTFRTVFATEKREE